MLHYKVGNLYTKILGAKHFKLFQTFTISSIYGWGPCTNCIHIVFEKICSPIPLPRIHIRGGTSEPDAFVKPWFTLKYGSQKRTEGLRTGQKTAKADSLILKPWFTLKSGSLKRTQNLHLHYKKGSLNRTRKCLTCQISTTLHCPLQCSEVSPLIHIVM